MLIVGTLHGAAPLSSQLKTARKTSPDFLEVRLDTFPAVIKTPDPVAHRLAKHLLKNAARASRRPLLLTVRSPLESGPHPKPSAELSEARRAGFYRALLPQARALDIELRHPRLLKSIGPLARRKKTKVIASFHDFKSVPSTARLNALVKKARALRADTVKFAVTVKDELELERFLRWGAGVKGIATILIAMGAAGRISRFLGGAFGSTMTFGHLGRSAAPGQPSVAELKEFFAQYERMK